MIAATPFDELPESYNGVNKKEASYNGLVVINAFQKYGDYHDLEGWLEALLQYESNWFSPMLDALKNKEFDQLVIRTNSKKIVIDKVARYKFWKKRKSLHSFKV